MGRNLLAVRVMIGQHWDVMKKIPAFCAAVLLPILPVAGEVKLSERLTRIAAHLGDGGVHFSVTDSKDDLKNLGEFIDNILTAVPDVEIPRGLRVETLFNDLGLYAIEGRGASSHQVGNLWHNRSFVLTNGDHEAVLSLLGDGAREPVAREFAPAGADLVLETSLNLREVERTAKKIARAFGPEVEEEVGMGLKEKVTNAGLALADIFTDFTVHGTLVFWLDQERTFPIDEERELPVPHFAARLDNAGIVWKLLKSELGDDSVIQEDDGELYLTPRNAKQDSPFGPIEPRFVWNPAKKQLFFGMTSGDLAACRGNGEKITTDEDFQKATAGLPEKTSGLAYASKDLFGLFVNLAKEFSAEVPPEAEGIVKELMPYVEKLAKEGGYAAAYSVEKDGFLFAANLPYPVKGESSLMGVGGVAAVATLASLGNAGFNQAVTQAREAQQINQMKMIAIAQIQYEIEEGVFATSLRQLVEAETLEREFAIQLDQAGLMFAVTAAGGAGKEGVIAYLQSPEPRGEVIVAFEDGSVKVLTRAELAELMEE